MEFRDPALYAQLERFVDEEITPQGSIYRPAAAISESFTVLGKWLRETRPPDPVVTFTNDGIGVRVRTSCSAWA
jgi:hypothetical protein